MEAPPPATIASDLDILRGIRAYSLCNTSFPYDDGEEGMIDFVCTYLQSDDADLQQVRHRMYNLREQYLLTRHTLWSRQDRPESLPLVDQEKFKISHFLWERERYSDSDTPTPNPSSPEKSYSADESNNTNASSDVNSPGNPSSPAHQSNTDTNIVVSSDSPNQSSSRISKDYASSSTTKRQRLFEDLNQQGGDRDTTATAAQDINILTKMVEYSEANNKVYPYISAEILSDFVKNWLHTDADPGQVGKRIQELHEMYSKYLILDNNNDEGGKPVYSDSPDDRSLFDLSKKLWHHEFGNANDDSGGGKSSGAKS
ncbi:hypothetical protein ACH5RR_009556 [Cinchona calisaya]|uniref:Glabrous enhancer-binding protein-like DBD domain-containing protein n=1 Tax=Cinchona calisaya TaxID=153742 RepID=A0ABD3AEQ9_9GENT